jgi:7-carboxy-7-deazaguanine synthase
LPGINQPGIIMKYYVSEYFRSIQGEGNFAGTNSFFIRFHFCNLACRWCDTKYTWLEKSGEYKEYTRDELTALIKNKSTGHVVFTGGEPSLYRLDELVCDSNKYHVESSGVIIPTEPLDIILSDGTSFKRDSMNESIISHFNWVISPKLSNTGLKIDNKYLKYWNSKEYCIFKFVIMNEKDLDEVDEVTREFNISKQKVYICLEGTTFKSQLRPALADRIIGYGFNYSPRLQVLLWGAKRGK